MLQQVAIKIERAVQRRLIVRFHLRTMAAQIRFLVLLFVAALFTASFADTIDVEEEDGIVYARRTSNISSLVDAMLPSIREYLTQQGLEPMRLDDITEKLSGPIIRNRYLYLTKGALKGLSKVKRAGDTIVVSDDGVFTLYATFGFDTLVGSYDYLFKDFLIARRGQLDGRFTNIEIKVVAGFNLKDRKVVLHAINIVRLDNLSITLKGHVIDPVLNAIIKRITNRFRNSIVSMMENQIAIVAQKYLNKLAEKIPLSNEYLVDSDILVNNDILNTVPTTYNFLLL